MSTICASLTFAQSMGIDLDQRDVSVFRGDAGSENVSGIYDCNDFFNSIDPKRTCGCVLSSRAPTPNRQGSVDQKYTRRAMQQEMVCYSTKYPFAQAGMPVASCDDDIGLSLVSNSIQLAAGVTGRQFDPSRR
jgi:hypothetical protein